MQVVSGHSLVLLLSEAESWEAEAGTLAVSIQNDVGELTSSAGNKQVEEAGVGRQWGDGGIAPVQQHVVLARQVDGLDLHIHSGFQFNSQAWNDHWLSVVDVIEQLHGQSADETPVVVFDCYGRRCHINLGVVDQIF